DRGEAGSHSTRNQAAGDTAGAHDDDRGADGAVVTVDKSCVGQVAPEFEGLTDTDYCAGAAAFDQAVTVAMAGGAAERIVFCKEAKCRCRAGGTLRQVAGDETVFVTKRVDRRIEFFELRNRGTYFRRLDQVLPYEHPAYDQADDHKHDR